MTFDTFSLGPLMFTKTITLCGHLREAKLQKQCDDLRKTLNDSKVIASIGTCTPVQKSLSARYA